MSFARTEPKTISFNEAWEKIKDSHYSSEFEGVIKGEPTGLKAGTQVNVDSLG